MLYVVQSVSQSTLFGHLGRLVDLGRSVVRLDLLVGQSVGRSARFFCRPMNVSFGDLMLLDSQDLLQTSGVIATVSASPENSSCIIVEY